MKNKKRNFLLIWILALALLLNVLAFVPVVAEGEPGVKDVTELLKGTGGWQFTVTQDDEPIDENGTIDSNKPIELKISFDVPVEGDFLDEEGKFSSEEKDIVRYGDYAIIKISKQFKLVGEDPVTVPLKTDANEVIGEVELYGGTEGDELGWVIAKITFKDKENASESIFSPDSDITNVSGWFSASLQYDGSGEAGEEGDHKITFLEKEYTVNVPTIPIDYTMVKKGDANLADRTITWTVDIEAKKGEDPIDLEGYLFEDDLNNVGDFVAGSFTVNGDVVSNTDLSYVDTEKVLSYTLPNNSTRPITIEFKTYIPDDKYFASGEQTVSNKAELTKGDVKKTASASVKFTPEWIEKSGQAGQDEGAATYNPKDRTITWTITFNHGEATLNNAEIIDMLPSELTFISATKQEWGDSGWGSAIAITPTDKGVYKLETVTKKMLLTIVAGVPTEDYTTGTSTYSNEATLKWDDGPSGGITGQPASVGIGYNAITKSGEQKAGGHIKWTVEVNAKGQEIPDLTVYDLLVYGTSLNLTGTTIDPAITGLSLNNLTRRYNQRYLEGTFSTTTGLEIAVHKVMKDGVAVADLLVIKGFSANKIVAHPFTFESLVVNPDIFAGNKSTTVYNTAHLYSANTSLNRADATISFTSSTLGKSILNRGSDPTTASGSNKTTNSAGNAFDYTDKTAIFRLVVNADDLNLTEMENANGVKLGNATVTDTLPLGWEFAPFSSTVPYYIYKATQTSGNTVTAVDPALSTITGLTYSVIPATASEGEKATFTFTTLDQPYVILLKAKMTDERALAFFSGNRTETFTNEVTLRTEKWTPGVSVTRTVSVTSKMLGKDVSRTENGVLKWTVSYNPYDLDIGGTKIADNLPEGIELRMDSKGKLIFAGNMTATEMVLQANGTYITGGSITLVEGTNVYYDHAERILTFDIPEPDKTYVFTYITDITGEPGTINNKATLFGSGEGEDVEVTASFVVTVADGGASLTRNGWVEILKIDAATRLPLKDARFTIFTKEGNLTFRTGLTGEDGKVRLKVLPEGEYVLKETEAPSGYTLDDVEHSLKISQVDGEIIASIDGKTGNDSNILTAMNFLSGTGNLTLSKKLSGNVGDPQKKFAFTISFFDEEGIELAGTSFPYFGNGVEDGSIAHGGQIELADGESIKIVGLPNGTKYKIEEHDYSQSGYTASPADGVIEGVVEVEIGTAELQAAFTNSYKVSWSPQLQKVFEAGGRELVEGEFFFHMKGEGLLKQSTNNASGNVAFDPIDYTEAGTWEYTFEEYVPGSSIETGITYSKNSITATVVVTINADRELDLDVTYEGSVEIEGNVFVNRYEAGGQWIPQVQKALDAGTGGRVVTNGEFEFLLVETTPGAGDDGVTARNDASGRVSFDAIQYDQHDIGRSFSYTITEVAGDEDEMVYDARTLNITVEITDAKQGQLIVDVTYQFEDENEPVEDPVFENTYTATGEWTPEVRKIFNAGGRELESNEFEFGLYYVGTESNVLLRNATNDNGDDVDVATFLSIDYSQNDIGKSYNYYIVEVTGTEVGVSYSTTRIDVNVQIEDGRNGTLIVTPVYTVDGQEIDASEDLVFENAYTASGSWAPEVKKNLDAGGRILEANEFEFRLVETTEGVDDDGVIVKNDSDGIVSFAAIEYDQNDIGNTFYYEITEVAGTEDKMVYDARTLNITVKVTDKKNGELDIDVSYQFEGDDEATTDPVFTNTYTAFGEWSPIVSKSLTGRGLRDKEFEFALIRYGMIQPTALPIGEVNAPLTVKNDGSGAVTFEAIEFSEEDIGKVYEFILFEIKPSTPEGNMHYDEREYRVEVEIFDAGNGVLEFKARYSLFNEGDETWEPLEIENVKFINAYTGFGSWTPEVIKSLVGRELKGNEFSFLLKDSQGNVIETVRNDDDGKVIFSPIGFSQFDIGGSYTYTIEEIVGDEPGMSYDTRPIEITVYVTDARNGQLNVDVSYPESTTFINRYSGPSGITVTANKVWKDLPSGWTEHLPTIWFKLYRSVEGKTAEAVPGLALQKLPAGVTQVSWNGLEKYDPDGKLYVYSVKEVDENGKDYEPQYFEKTEKGLTVTNAFNKELVEGDEDFETEIDVTGHKVWKGVPKGQTVPTIWLKLYRHIEGGTPVAVAGRPIMELRPGVTQGTWKDLEKVDDDYNYYIYSVKEVDNKGNDYEPPHFCKTEEGLTVTNTHTAGAPVTGETLSVYTIMGAMLMALAALFLILTGRKRAKAK